MKTLKALGIIGLLTILGAIYSSVFFFGGYFSIAATVEDPGIVKWAFVTVRQASIARHAIDKPPIALDDVATVTAGARAFAARGCVTCHGAPGVEWAKFGEAMRPDPPDLVEVAKAVEPAQIFWVIKNGIRFTGMPGFSLIGADDREIWSIVAFVKKLPSVSEADFKAWTAPAPKPTP